MKIACLQLDIAWEDQEKNYSKTEELIKKTCSSSSGKPDFICLPELFSTGVTLDSKKFEETIDGKTCLFLSRVAKENKIYLLGGFIEKKEKENKDDLPFNSAVVYNPKGELIAKYNKNHVFTLGDEHKAYSNGSGISVFKLKDFDTSLFI